MTIHYVEVLVKLAAMAMACSRFDTRFPLGPGNDHAVLSQDVDLFLEFFAHFSIRVFAWPKCEGHAFVQLLH